MVNIKLLSLFTILILSGCITKPIGGERDEHGCIGSAGYTFDKEIGACTRNWEIKENQKQAAKIAVDYVNKKGLIVIEVLVARCPGCFSVELQDQDYRKNRLTIENWEVTDISQSLTPEECIAKGGRTVNIVDGSKCNENETNIGEVTGFISPNICCVKIDSFKDCIKAGFPIMESYPRQCKANDKTFVEEI